MSTLLPVAQTNVQLYSQLRSAGWEAGDIEDLGAAHDLAMTLLSGQWRGNGRPFICHFVGTASIVAACGERPAMVRAALMHNAYRHGEWGDGWPRATARRRSELRARVGAEAEELVNSYHSFRWFEPEIHDLLNRVQKLDSRTRDLTLLRLANEVEDRLDLGLLHSEQKRKNLAPMCELAEGLAMPLLASHLRSIAEEEAIGCVEPGLRRPGRGTVLLAPRSHRRTIRSIAGSQLPRVRRSIAVALQRIGSRVR